MHISQKITIKHIKPTTIEAQKQLLLDLSHELKTPLTRAKLSLENLKINKHTKDISQDLVEMNYIISFILDTEKLENKKVSLMIGKNIS